MKNKLGNLLWAILFSWIIVSGTVYTDTKCRDQGYSLCDQTGSPASKAETSISTCAYSFQYLTIFSFAAEKKDFCCKDRICGSPETLFLRTQNTNFQKQSVNFVYARPMPLNKAKALNPIFVHHKSIQTISIYTITQSFLC